MQMPGIILIKILNNKKPIIKNKTKKESLIGGII
jgi:hypothetical protein